MNKGINMNYEKFLQDLNQDLIRCEATKKLIDGVEKLIDVYNCREEFEEFLKIKAQEEALNIFYNEFLVKSVGMDKRVIYEDIGFSAYDEKERIHEADLIKKKANKINEEECWLG